MKRQGSADPNLHWQNSLDNITKWPIDTFYTEKSPQCPVGINLPNTVSYVDQGYKNPMCFVQGCNFAMHFIQPFHCPHSPASYNVAPNILKVYNVVNSQCISYNVAINTRNLAHIACILCNILRTGRMGTMKRLYKIHRKIATLHKIHRICVTLI